MPNDNGVLGQVLKRVLRDDRAVSNIFRRLSAYFDIAGRKRYELTSGHYGADEGKMVSALAKATQRQVKRAIFLSASGKGQSTLTPDEMYQLKQGLSLGDSLWQALWDKNRYWLMDGFRKGPGDDLRLKLECALRDALGRPLEAALQESLKAHPVWLRHRACIGNGVWDCLNYWIGFSALNDKFRLGRLDPLFELLPHQLPVSERKNEPGTWIVLIG